MRLLSDSMYCGVIGTLEGLNVQVYPIVVEARSYAEAIGVLTQIGNKLFPNKDIEVKVNANKEVFSIDDIDNVRLVRD